MYTTRATQKHGKQTRAQPPCDSGVADTLTRQRCPRIFASLVFVKRTVRNSTTAARQANTRNSAMLAANNWDPAQFCPTTRTVRLSTTAARQANTRNSAMLTANNWDPAECCPTPRTVRISTTAARQAKTRISEQLGSRARQNQRCSALTVNPTLNLRQGILCQLSFRQVLLF